MSLKNHIRWQIEQCHWITMSYVQDMADADFLLRPVPGMNHIAWQLGHLITSTKKMLGWLGQPSPALPTGFEEGYTKETAGSDDPKKFATKDVYLDLAAKSKAASLAALDAIPKASWTIRARSRCGSMPPPLRPADHVGHALVDARRAVHRRPPQAGQAADVLGPARPRNCRNTDTSPHART